MSEPQFFQTGMGRKYYEHTLPELVRQIARLNDNLDRLVALLDDRRKAAGDAPAAEGTR